MHTEELLGKYRGAKSAAKRGAAMAKGKKYDEVYEQLGTREGEKEVYRIARSEAEGCWKRKVCEG